jgi:hypothetical protein
MASKLILGSFPSYTGGPKGALGSAVACGILLGVFEGVGVLFSRFFAEGMRPQLPPCKTPFVSCSLTLTVTYHSTGCSSASIFNHDTSLNRTDSYHNSVLSYFFFPITCTLRRIISNAILSSYRANCYTLVHGLYWFW